MMPQEQSCRKLPNQNSLHLPETPIHMASRSPPAQPLPNLHPRHEHNPPKPDQPNRLHFPLRDKHLQFHLRVPRNWVLSHEALKDGTGPHTRRLPEMKACAVLPECPQAAHLPKCLHAQPDNILLHQGRPQITHLQQLQMALTQVFRV
jgi:hypothetical protein